MNNNLNRVLSFLDECQTYYLATVEGDQPRVRPFGTALIYNDKLYIQTGKVKNVSKQLAINPKAEICAFKDGTWVRITGELIEDETREVKTMLLDKMPYLRNMYNEDDGNMQMLYFKNAKAVFMSFGKDSEEFEI
ncbi:MAG: pyridoxamine 5'-phosphate oxidase family protein [Bacilli bacterium]|nr:pyridoxamine 5'-phosphate oxidase family protein [Bacilli bacterium]